MSERRCHACGAAIAPKRLIAVPSTPWCVRCAESRVVRVGGVARMDADGAQEVEVVRSVALARTIANVESRAAMVVLDRPQESISSPSRRGTVCHCHREIHRGVVGKLS